MILTIYIQISTETLMTVFHMAVNRTIQIGEFVQQEKSSD